MCSKRSIPKRNIVISQRKFWIRYSYVNSAVNGTTHRQMSFGHIITHSLFPYLASKPNPLPLLAEEALHNDCPTDQQVLCAHPLGHVRLVLGHVHEQSIGTSSPDEAR